MHTNFNDLITAISDPRLKNNNFEVVICGEGDQKKN